jgi:threonylcarbamoyladenosine tRNA methylthiotransferase MtaB
MNWLDSARLSAALQGAGHDVVMSEKEAEFIVVNTCTVTGEADRKSRQTVNSAGKLQKQVAVIGCGPKVDDVKWQQQAANSLIFSHETQLLEYFGIESDTLPFPLTSRTRLPVAIQQGCDNHCTFCITRVARGAHTNISAETVISQIRQAEEMGIREIVLTGINLAAWGCEDSNKPRQTQLPRLLEQILERTTIPRIRFSSLGPEYLQQDFFELFSDERFCDYLHLSVQSGSRTVLQRMQRGHGSEEILKIAELARVARPEVALACDMIVGFPGESDREFNETVDFSRAMRFAKMHIFPFSPRDGTSAAVLPNQLDGVLKKQRCAVLRQLAGEMRKYFVTRQLGKPHHVLVEGRERGLTGNYIRVKCPNNPEGVIVRVVLKENNLEPL